jgi:hypothetical protein
MVVKYGAITPEIIQAAELAGNELIVLEVPKGADIDSVVTVEQSLDMFLRLDAG